MKKVNAVFLLLLVLVLATKAMAESGGGGEHHDEGIPTVVWYQVVHFALFVGILFYLLKNIVVKYYAGRQSSYREQFEKAKAHRQGAEDLYVSLKKKIEQHDLDRDSALKKAQGDATSLRAKMMGDAAEQAQQIKTDAQRSADQEAYQAQEKLRKEFLDRVLNTARGDLQDRVGDAEQGRLQKEFVDQVQAVQ